MSYKFNMSTSRYFVQTWLNSHNYGALLQPTWRNSLGCQHNFDRSMSEGLVLNRIGMFMIPPMVGASRTKGSEGYPVPFLMSVRIRMTRLSLTAAAPE
jgi:hypothetical protein